MEAAEHADTPGVDADADTAKDTNTPAQTAHSRKFFAWI